MFSRSKDKNFKQTLDKQVKIKEIPKSSTVKECFTVQKQKTDTTKETKESTPVIKKQNKKEIIKEFKEEIKTKNIEDLQAQIKQKIESEDTTFAELHNLKIKAEILKTFAVSQSEELKYQQLKNNLFDKSEILKIYSYVLNNIRNSLLNLSSNYAVSLEGLNKKQIKDYVDLDINKILEELYGLKDKF